MLALPALALLFTVCGAVRSESELEMRFRTEAPVGWMEHESLATHAQGVITGQEVLVDQTNAANNEIGWRFVGTFHLSGDSRRRIVYTIPPAKLELVSCRNPEYGFSLQKDYSQRDHAIQDLRSASDSTDMGFARGSEELIYAAFAISPELRLAEMIRRPEFRLLSLKEVSSGASAFVELRFSCPLQDAEMIALDNELVILDPSNGWSIQRWEHSSEPDIVRQFVVEYQTTPLGKLRLRVPSQVVFTVRSRDAADPVMTERTVRFQEFEQFEGDASLFTLTAFGLPEPTLGEPPSRWRGWLMPVIFIQIGLLLMYLGRRWYRSVQEW